MPGRSLSSIAAFVLCAVAHVAGPAHAAQPAKPLACDDSIMANFKPDALTKVVMVKAFRKGEPLQLAEGTGGPRPAVARPAPLAANDLCMVKLMVGPGNPGPADAPSTSLGIGIEIWLPTPANWNNRVHTIGGGGFAGGTAGLPTAIADQRVPQVAGTEGAVSSFTDAGHQGGAGFALNPDGSINTALWRDMNTRSLHEQAVKTKALATAYYGRAPKFSYFEGGSQGGRQAYALAQSHPDDYNGIVGTMPAVQFTRFLTAWLYPQILFFNELGGKYLTEGQQDLVSNAAIRSCDVVGGKHLGYIMEPATCRYDATADPDVICQADGGKNATADCVTRKEASVINRIWYGPTRDGSAPSPATDNGWQSRVTDTSVRRWYGLPRGTSLYNYFYSRLYGFGAGMTSPGGMGADMLPIVMQNPKMGSPTFRNATGNGADGWKTLSYAQLAGAIDRAVTIDPQLLGANTTDTDLSRFKAHGGKLLTWHGFNDEMIPVQGTIDYYDDVVKRMGGLANVQSFYRLYLLPGNGHGYQNGTSNQDAHPPQFGLTQPYEMLVNWVEKGVAPGRVDISSPQGSPNPISQPACLYPLKASYVGGDPTKAASYRCS